MFAHQLMTRPCIIESPVTSDDTDDMGDPLDSQPERVVTVCEVQQSSSREARDGGLIDVQVWNIYLPAGSRPRASSIVHVDGLRIALDGGPWPVRDPLSGVESHVEAKGRQVA